MMRLAAAGSVIVLPVESTIVTGFGPAVGVADGDGVGLVQPESAAVIIMIEHNAKHSKRLL